MVIWPDGNAHNLLENLLPAGFDPAALVRAAAGDRHGHRRHADTRPVVRAASDLKAGEKRPGLIFFHGGSRRQMLLNWHYNYYYRNAYAMNQWLASQGYVVLSVNYRSGIGYGLEFREALNYGATQAAPSSAT